MRVFLIAIALLVALPVVAQDKPSLWTVGQPAPSEVGKLYFDHKKQLWVFEGDADASAKILLEKLNGGKGCTHADVLDALRRARKWLPANEEASTVMKTPAINLWREPQTAAAQLREQADDLERVDAVLRACRN